MLRNASIPHQGAAVALGLPSLRHRGGVLPGTDGTHVQGGGTGRISHLGWVVVGGFVLGWDVRYL